MTFPITLIKLITEYVPTPCQLVEHELQTKGLPVMKADFRRQMIYFSQMQPIVNYGPAGDVPEYVVEMRVELNNYKRRHVQMRADLMAFHLSKV